MYVKTIEAVKQSTDAAFASSAEKQSAVESGKNTLSIKSIRNNLDL
jgi:hypothetical protein